MQHVSACGWLLAVRIAQPVAMGRFLPLPVCCCWWAVTLGAAAAAVPTVDDLAADWVEAGEEVDMPQISAFTNELGTNSDDLFSINSFLSAPFASGTSLCTMLIDGVQLRPTRHRHRAYEATRQANHSGTRVTVATRPAFAEPAVLWQVTFEGGAAAGWAHTVSLALTPLVRQVTALPWVNKYPNRTSDFNFSLSSSAAAGGGGGGGGAPFLYSRDKHSAAQSAFGFVHGSTEQQAQWSVSPGGGWVNLTATVAKGRSTTLRFLFVVGNATWPLAAAPERGSRNNGSRGSTGGVIRRYQELADLSSWTRAWDGAAMQWERRWQAAFTPGNGHFSGHLPTLVSPSAELSRTSSIN